MDVKEATKIALDYVRDLFSREEIMHLGLEEVEISEAEDEWLITVGFSRPWDLVKTQPHPLLPVLTEKKVEYRREYKVVRINNKSGMVRSLSNREQR